VTKKKKKQANTGGRVSHSFPHHDLKLVHTVESASFSRLLTFLTNHPTEAFGVFTLQTSTPATIFLH